MKLELRKNPARLSRASSSGAKPEGSPATGQDPRGEEALWRTWVAGGKRPDDLRPLMTSLQPLAQRAVTKYRAADVATPALRTHVENQMVRGLNSYDPKKGSLSTHLNWQMRGVGRFVEKHQNFARIPGSRIHAVGRFQQARSQLSDELGRAPTLTELAKRSRLSRVNAGKLERELQPVHVTGLMVDEFGAPMDDFGSNQISADLERLDLIYPELTSAEQLVVDYSLGRAGKPRITSTQLLAAKIGVSPSRVSNMRAAIARKTRGLSWVR